MMKYRCAWTRLSFIAVLSMAVIAASLLLFVLTDRTMALSTKAQFEQDPNDFIIGGPPDGVDTILKGAETNSIRVTAEMKTINKLGKPINIRMALSNNRNEDLELMHNVDGSDFYLYVVNSDHKPVPLSEYGHRMAASLFQGFHNEIIRLHPHESLARDYDVTQYFNISVPGTYRLSIVKAVKGTASIKWATPYFDVEISSIVFVVK